MPTVATKAVSGSAGIDHVALNQNKGERSRGIYHTQNVNAYHSRLKGWMEHFRGVATKYLDNYMTWFADIDMTRHITRGIWEQWFLAMSCIDSKKVQYKSLPNKGICMICHESIEDRQNIVSIFFVSHDTGERELDLLCHSKCFHQLGLHRDDKFVC